MTQSEVQATILSAQYTMANLINANLLQMQAGNGLVKWATIRQYNRNITGLTACYEAGDYVSANCTTLYNCLNSLIGINVSTATIDPNFQNPGIIIDVNIPYAPLILIRSEADLIPDGQGGYYLPFNYDDGSPIVNGGVPVSVISNSISISGWTFDETTVPARIYGFANNDAQTIMVTVLNAGTAPTPPPPVTPTLSSIVILDASPSQIELTYSAALDTGSVPQASDFAITPSNTITGVSISGSSVFISVTTPYVSSDTPTLSYVPGTNPIRSSVGHINATAFINHAITNDVLPAKNIQLIFIGDSITGGEGTTGVGPSSIGPYNVSNSYPQQAAALLATAGVNVTPLYLGFPGGYASLYASGGGLDTTLAMFDYHNYTDIYCVLFFGANDLLGEDDVAFRADITPICAALRAANAKVIIMPVLSRKDAFAAAVSYINITRRNAFNTWLTANFATIADAVVDLTPYPNIFTDNAPDDSTYFAAPDADGLSKVHPTDAGATYLAQGLTTAVEALALTPSIPLTDPDNAALFLTATGITDSTITSAIDTLVTALKNAKLWNKLAAIYPFVGGTAATHKFNLKDPRDLDAAFRLIFTGSPTNDANGITWAGGSYADTKYIQYSGNRWFSWNCSMSYYSRTNGNAGIDTGNTTARLGILLGGACYDEVNNGFTGGQSVLYSSTLGLFTTTRETQTSTSHSEYKDGVLDHAVNLGMSTGIVSTVPFFIGVENDNGSTSYPSNRNCAYFALGHGLTAAEEAAHYTIIQAFQTALSRQV